MTTEATEQTKTRVDESIDSVIRICKERQAVQQRTIDWLERRREKLNLLGFEISAGYQSVDFDCLSHADAMKVMLAFPGTWKKEQNGSKVDYTLENQPVGPDVRCWGTDLSPKCRIVETVVEVPEKTIPAHREIQKKIVCDGDPEAV